MPTVAQLESLYRVSYKLTYIMFQPIHLICVDDRTRNIYLEIQAEIEAAKQAYEMGDYLTLDEYTKKNAIAVAK